jgi:hypothetical protein
LEQTVSTAVSRIDASDAASERPDIGDRMLLWSAAPFTVGVLIHNADHVRRGADAVPADVFWVGTSAIALEVAIVVLCCQGHRLAPLVAAVSGLLLMTGYILVHFLPARGWLSDSFTSARNTSSLSWFAASLEVVAVATLGLVGLRVLAARGGLASVIEPHGPQLPLRAALLHPITVTMVLGNAVVLVMSFSQR